MYIEEISEHQDFKAFEMVMSPVATLDQQYNSLTMLCLKLRFY